jgi:hypothetical protein
MAIQANPYEQGGILGPKAQGLLDTLRGPTAQVNTPGLQAPQEATAVDQPVGPNYKTTGQYLGNRFKNEKSQRPWEDQSERYKIGTVLSNFDPKQGITADLIAALNGADLTRRAGQAAGD